MNSKSEPLFESATMWPPSVMDIVLKQLDLSYYTAAHVPEKLRELGRATSAISSARKSTCGYTTDMMNFAHSTDVYQIWADMVTSDERKLPDSGEHFCCVYAGRRDGYTYKNSHEEILSRYGGQIVMCERMPEMMVPQMGNQMYTAKVANEAAVEEFIRFVQESCA